MVHVMMFCVKVCKNTPFVSHFKAKNYELLYLKRVNTVTKYMDIQK